MKDIHKRLAWDEASTLRLLRIFEWHFDMTTIGLEVLLPAQLSL